MMIFSERMEFEKAFEKWAEVTGVVVCASSMITFLETHPEWLAQINQIKELEDRVAKNKALFKAISMKILDYGGKDLIREVMRGSAGMAVEFDANLKTQKDEVERLKTELKEYGPDFVGELQQKIDELKVEISCIKTIMTTFHDDHVYGTKGTEGWFRPCCKVDDRKPHLEGCEVGEIIGNNKPRHGLAEEDDRHKGGLTVGEAQQQGVCRICRKIGGAREVIGKVDPFILNFGREYAHQSCLEREEDDGHEVGELNDANATVMWTEGGDIPSGVVLGQLPNSTGGDEESGSPGSEGKREEDQVGDGGEQGEDV
jgi:hypothetical protein